MKTSDLLKMCVENLRRRKFRTFLTVIGVVIGTAAIISMISLAIGIRKSTDDLISGWGDLSIIDVYSGMDTKLDEKVLEEITVMDGVRATTPFLRTYYFNNGNFFAGKNDRYKTDIWSLVGVYPQSLHEFGYDFETGAAATEKSSKRFYAVLGSDVPYQFEDTKKSYDNFINSFPDPETGEVPDPFFDPLKEDLKLSINYGDYDNKDKVLEYDVRVSGVLKMSGGDFDQSRYTIYMDVNDLQKITDEYYKAQKTKNPNKGNYDSAKIKVDDIKKVAEIEASIKAMGLESYSLEGQRLEALKSTQNLQIILGALGGVSLIVAAISIANTMVMSVYERTKEIGIMKVLGCFVKDIRTIFLTEAAMIGFLGGLIGVAISYIISFVVNYISIAMSQGGGGGGSGRYGSMFGGMSSMMFMGGGEEVAKISVIPLWLVAVGMIFATTVGILAGFYPASRAVKISALEAIKQD